MGYVPFGVCWNFLLDIGLKNSRQSSPSRSSEFEKKSGSEEKRSPRGFCVENRDPPQKNIKVKVILLS